METTTKKITLATVKSFIKKNQDQLFIKLISKFDGMTDGISFTKDAGFIPAEKDTTESKNSDYNDRTHGIKGAWFVGSSRDYFTAFEDDNLIGYKVSNSCGSFILAAMKKPAPKPVEVKVGDCILFFRGIGTFDCIVTSTTEKAVKVDYENSSTMAGHAGRVSVYSRTGWMPKKALKACEGMDGIFDVHSWFNFDKTFAIKPYFLKNGEKIFV